MLTCALAQGRLTSQEYTPFLKWLLLLVSSFGLPHWWRLQDGLIVAHAHLCTPTVVDCLLSNVVKCTQKMCVNSQQPFFPHKIQFNWSDFRDLSKCGTPKGQVPGLQLTLPKPHRNCRDWWQSTLYQIDQFVFGHDISSLISLGKGLWLQLSCKGTYMHKCVCTFACLWILLLITVHHPLVMLKLSVTSSQIWQQSRDF